jgi:tape measure domain-containing protein
MGVRALVNVSDTVTKAENKLNYVSSQALGAEGVNENGSYSAKTLATTQEALDKMYDSSQKVRMSYSDMMSNVSKSMALAGDSFGNNIDSAIRFQEIMAESYALGGASAQEMSSSMYQLIQALGAGILAGDELRSVREGAPLAYKAIEKYAQGVMAANEATKDLAKLSLKDLASEGYVTSDMVVAAIMDAGEELDNAFAQTAQTFEQTWDQIKNAAIKAFEPVGKVLRETLKKAIDNGLIQKFETIFINIAKAVLIMFEVVSNVVSWIVDNWDWLKHILVAGLLVLAGMWIWQAGVAIMSAIATILAITPIQWILIIILAAVLAVIFVFYLWQQGAINMGQVIIAVLAIIAIAILLIGLITHTTWAIILGVVMIGVVAIMSISSNLCEFIINLATYIVYFIIAVLAVVLVAYLATGTLMLSIPVLIALLVIGVILAVLAVFLQFTGEIVGGAYGIKEVFFAVCHNIGIFFTNMVNKARAGFWNLIGDMLSGLSSLEPALNAIAKLFGMEGFSLSTSASNAYAKATEAQGKIKEYESVSGAWDKGYSEGYAIGEGIQNKINGWGDKIKNFGSQFQSDDDSSLLDNIGKKLGLDLSGMAMPNPDDLAYTLDGISDDVGNISDSMDLTNDELDYLRRIADMEWRNEFTTAEIKVDMTNHNTVNGERDLDGIVEYLSDTLRAEMTQVAYGVHL